MQYGESTFLWKTVGDVILMGMIVECLCDDPVCPLANVHALPLKDRVVWASQLSIEERTRILNHYYAVRFQFYDEFCSTTRELTSARC